MRFVRGVMIANGKLFPKGKSFWNSHRILYRLDKAPTLTLFMPFHLLNASCGLLKWFLEKFCPRPTITSFSFVPTSDYLLSFLVNHKSNNSVTLSSLCPQPLPRAPSSQPSHSGLTSVDQQQTFNSQPLSPPACPRTLWLHLRYSLTSDLHPSHRQK